MVAGCGGDSLPDLWWHDLETLRRERRAHGSLAQAAIAHGVKPNTVQKKWSTLGGERLPTGPRATGPEQAAAGAGDEWLLELLRKSKWKGTVEELADDADVSPKRVREAAGRLQDAGYRIELDEVAVTVDRVAVATEFEHKVLFDGDTYRFGIVSDVHTSSKHCRLEELHIAYDRLHAEGITDVYNPGDIVSGRGIFRGQDHEITNHTFETQVDHAVDVYPRRDGITTRIISGNHDCEGDFGRAGADACLAVANQRDDIEWCGRYYAKFQLPNRAVMEMRHPMGGSSYAKSYKPQKFAESFEGGYKPALVLFGHWHNVEWGFHRNVHMLNCGTFEGYGGSLGHRVPLGSPAVGFWIVEATLARDGSLVRFKPEFLAFYAGRKAKAA